MIAAKDWLIYNGQDCLMLLTWAILIGYCVWQVLPRKKKLEAQPIEFTDLESRN